MQKGRLYKVRYQIPGIHQVPREAVMKFTETQSQWDEYVFDARPAAGTQKLKRGWVLSTEEVPRGTKVYMNRRA